MGKEGVVRVLTWVLILCCVVPALGMEIQWRLAPDGPKVASLPLGSQFYVAVTACEADRGEIVLFNLRTGQLIRVPLEKRGAELLAGPVLLRHPTSSVGGTYVLEAQLGHVLLASTSLGTGLGTTAWVVPPSLTSGTLSTPVALPGSVVRLRVHVISGIALPQWTVAIQLPDRWQVFPEGTATATPDGFRWLTPVRDGQGVVFSFLVVIPIPEFGEHRIGVHVRELGAEAHAVLSVADRLPLEVVVAHWDVAHQALDLTLPPTLTYEQLLWATRLLGKPVPYSDAILTQEILETLAERWQNSLPAYLVTVPVVLSPQPPAPVLQPPPVEKPAAPPPASPLVAHWALDEGTGTNAADATTNQNTATLHSVFWTTGKLGPGLKFDGEKSYLEIADSPSLDLGEEFTLSAWVNLAQVGTGRQVLMQKKPLNAGDTHTNYTFYVQWTHDALALVIGDGDRRVGYLSDRGIETPNKWCHVAVTFSGGRVVFYINGQPAGVRTATVRPHMNDGPLMIGRYTGPVGGPLFPLSGVLDELRIYNRALTEQEVARLASERGG